MCGDRSGHVGRHPRARSRGRGARARRRLDRPRPRRLGGRARPSCRSTRASRDRRPTRSWSLARPTVVISDASAASRPSSDGRTGSAAPEDVILVVPTLGDLRRSEARPVRPRRDRRGGRRVGLRARSDRAGPLALLPAARARRRAARPAPRRPARRAGVVHSAVRPARSCGRARSALRLARPDDARAAGRRRGRPRPVPRDPRRRRAPVARPASARRGAGAARRSRRTASPRRAAASCTTALPLPGVEMRVNDADGGIELRGPMLMLGYRFDAEATAARVHGGRLAASRRRRRDRRRGTPARRRADRRPHQHGRREGVAGRGRGRRFASIRRWPRSAVGGRLDPEWGQHVVVCVVPADPGRPADARGAAGRSRAPGSAATRRRASWCSSRSCSRAPPRASSAGADVPGGRGVTE